MSAVTLEALRADFDNCWTMCSEFAHAYAVAEEAYQSGHQYPTYSDGRIGTIYFIARDHGLEAAMLYKLSDGAIDPRQRVHKLPS